MRMRAGAHGGAVMLSRLGHDRHQQITISGDCVNVASRLMEVAKADGAWLCVSADLWDQAQGERAVRPDPAARRPVEIRGRRQPLDVALWRG